MIITPEVLNIMSCIELIIKAACLLVGIASACVITIPKLRSAIKQRKAATTEAEKAEADLAIRSHMIELIATVETNYKGLDKAMKTIGQSAGALKKDKVMSDLRDFCDDNGYVYDKEELAKQVDEYVALTNVVNTNKQN